MFKKLTTLLSVTLLLMGCAPAVLNTVMKVNIGEAKRFAKSLIDDDKTIDLRKYAISGELKDYLTSDEGIAYFDNLKKENGPLKKLKLRSINGATSDTMNYRFIATFTENEYEREVRVQTFEDSRFVNVFVAPWQDKMKPLEK